MKIFYSAEDIENFADRGQREIRIDENTVLTDLAKQTARMRGIRLTKKTTGATADTNRPARPRRAGQTPVLGHKPRGCQRRPVNRSSTAPGPSAGKSSQVVDQLVEKIKRISSR